jgi:WD40 repeat protein
MLTRLALVLSLLAAPASAGFEGHGGFVNAVAFAADWRTALSGSWDTTTALWDLESGRELRVFEGHAQSVNDVAFLPDGRLVASYSATGAKLWS